MSSIPLSFPAQGLSLSLLFSSHTSPFSLFHSSLPWGSAMVQAADAFCCRRYGSIFIQICACSGLQKTHLFCNRVRFGRSKSFTVIQGRWFWYQSKARIRFPVSPSLWLWSYLAPFLRYGDLLAKNCLFFPTPFSFGALAPHAPFLEFRGEVNREESRVMGLSSSEDRMILAGDVLSWSQRVTDGRSDGQNLS